MREAKSLRDRYAAFGRLELTGRRGIPFVQQLNVADCGAACLTMALRHHGYEATLDEVRDAMRTGRDGASARAIVEAARAFGLRARAVRLEPGDVNLLDRGAILHWRMRHFVVLSAVRRGGRVEIVDPSSGSRLTSKAEFDSAFTGVAVLLEPTPEFRPQRRRESPARRYLGAVTRHADLLSKIIVTSVLLQGAALALPLFTKIVVDRVVPRADYSLLLVVSVGTGVLVIFDLVASVVRAHLLLHLRTTIDVQLTMNFVDHLLRLPYSYFQLRQTGDLLNRIGSNATIRETLTSAALSAVLDGALVTSYLIVLLAVNLHLGLWVLGLGVLRVVVYWGSRGRYRRYMAESLLQQAKASDYQVQVIEGIEALKMGGAEADALERWSHMYVDVLNVALRQGRLSAWVDSAMRTVGLASPLVLIGYGGHLVLDGRLSLGTMLAMTALAAGFLGPLSSMILTALRLQSVTSHIERVDDVLRQKPEPRRPGVTKRISGAVTIEDMSFRYAEGGQWAIRSLDVEMPLGAQVGIVGRNGSGKSTLARLLVGLYEPHSGRVLYDGDSLHELDLPSVRRQVGFVSQVPFLFAGSIRSNIILNAPDASLTEVHDAARIAGLHDEIEAMPLKYETPVSSGGRNLAGGQRQRIAIARAVLRKPSVLILDEATSHLDAFAERTVHESLAAMECTRVVIAHRLSAVVASDLILVLNRGQVVERGGHAELMAARGEYWALFREQSSSVKS